LNIHHKPCALWNVAEYYNSFLAFLSHARSEGFLKVTDYERLLVVHNIDELFMALSSFVPAFEAVPVKLLD
jgi:hypothetical protein